MKHRERVRKHHEHHADSFNGRLALRITLVVGSMWCAYVFTLLALVGLPSALGLGLLPDRSLIIVAWVAQTFLQLVLLPIIIVGQNIQAKASDERAEATYKDAEAVLKAAERIEKHLQSQDEELSRIVSAARKK